MSSFLPNLFQGGKVTSGLSSLRLAEGSSNGGDEVGTNMGKGGGIPDDDASDLVGESMKGSGGGAGDNTDKGGDSGSYGDGSGGSGGEGTGAGIEILAVTRYAGCSGGVAADSSVSNDFVSSTDGA
ncbi:hypothetical protein Tco_1486527 [Tanacetum coccineum]